jgi:chitinase
MCSAEQSDSAWRDCRTKATRINYAFANLQSGRIVNGFAAVEGNIASLVALKQENPSLTVLVSV